MLAVSLLLMVTGCLLVYAGMSGSSAEYWKQPWLPLVTLFQVKGS